MVLQRMSEAAPAKRPSEGDSSIQDALDRVAKRLKVKKQSLLQELQAEFRLPASDPYPTALPANYGSQIYDWLDAHDDEDESDSGEFSDAVETQNEASSVNHLPTPPDAQTGQARRDKEPLSATFEPARPVSQEEERKALLGIFRAASSGGPSTNLGKGEWRRLAGNSSIGKDADVESSPPTACKNRLDTSDIESVNSFLEQEEGGTELTFEPKPTSHPPENVLNQRTATTSRPRVPDLKREALENDNRPKETGSSAPFVTASKRKAHADDTNGTAVTTTQVFVTKSKRQNLIDNDEGIREVEGVETEAAKLFKGVFGYSPTSDPWKAHSLAKGPGNIDRKGDRDQTMVRRVAAVLVGAPTKWVSFTVLPSARRPAAPGRFRNAPTLPLVAPTVKNQMQAYQIYPMNRSIQLISEGLANRQFDELKQKQSPKAHQVWEQRKQALTLDLKVPEEPPNIQGGLLPPPLPPPQHQVSPYFSHQASYPYREERGPPPTASRPGQTTQYMAPQSKKSSIPEAQSFQYKRDPMTRQLKKVPYTPANAEHERAEAYYQRHIERAREAKARQRKHALDGS